MIMIISLSVFLSIFLSLSLIVKVTLSQSVPITSELIAVVETNKFIIMV